MTHFSDENKNIELLSTIGESEVDWVQLFKSKFDGLVLYFMSFIPLLYHIYLTATVSSDFIVKIMICYRLNSQQFVWVNLKQTAD